MEERNKRRAMKEKQQSAKHHDSYRRLSFFWLDLISEE